MLLLLPPCYDVIFVVSPNLFCRNLFNLFITFLCCVFSVLFAAVMRQKRHVL